MLAVDSTAFHHGGASSDNADTAALRLCTPGKDDVRIGKDDVRIGDAVVINAGVVQNKVLRNGGTRNSPSAAHSASPEAADATHFEADESVAVAEGVLAGYSLARLRNSRHDTSFTAFHIKRAFPRRRRVAR